MTNEDTQTIAAPLQVSPPSEWRKIKEDGFLVKLPSGKVARLKRTLSLITQMAVGGVPSPLRAQVEKMFQGDLIGLRIEDLSPREYDQMATLINAEIPNIFVEPTVYEVPDGENPITWIPDDVNGISLTDISWEDRSFAYSFAQGGPAELEQFQELVKLMEPVSDQQVLPHPTEQAAEDS